MGLTSISDKRLQELTAKAEVLSANNPMYLRCALRSFIKRKPWQNFYSAFTADTKFPSYKG